MQEGYLTHTQSHPVSSMIPFPNMTGRAGVTRQQRDDRQQRHDGVALAVEGGGVENTRSEGAAATSCRRIAAVALWGMINGSNGSQIRHEKPLGPMTTPLFGKRCRTIGHTPQFGRDQASGVAEAVDVDGVVYLEY